ncbi:MAG: hypothetical protein ACLP1Q_20360 [Solirubrobacteraceae bacterium]
MSQRAFDAAANANASAAPAGLPAARNIAKSLDLPWREVVALAHEPPGQQNHRLSQKQTAPYQDWLTEEYVASVLKLAAHRLGVDTLTPDRYRAVAAELAAADNKRWLHGRQLLIPSDDQIITACGGASANAPRGGGGWDRALVLAGLKPRPGLGDQGMSRKAPPITDVMERFHDAHGVQPSARTLKAFARANGIPYAREEHKKWSEWLDEWKQSRRERGLPEPRVVQHVGGRGVKAPDYAVNVGAARPDEQRLNKWTEETCAAAVARYLAQLPAGQRSTKRGYDDWAKQQTPRAPASSNFDIRGGWETIRRKAIASL